jgi:hypothetical protein
LRNKKLKKIFLYLLIKDLLSKTYKLTYAKCFGEYTAENWTCPDVWLSVNVTNAVWVGLQQLQHVLLIIFAVLRPASSYTSCFTELHEFLIMKNPF